MKMIVHRTPISANQPFVLDEVKQYARIDGSGDDLTLGRMGRAAAAEVEHFAQVALLTQTIRVTILDLVHDAGLTLPIGPMAEGATAIVTIDGEPFTGFDLVTGMRPYLSWPASIRGAASDRVVIEYPAGFGDAPEDVPDDLSQAVLDQVALTFDERAPREAKTLARSSHLARVGTRYRGVSI
jgi:uncharacterized phiE125 gp8 family phage protein